MVRKRRNHDPESSVDTKRPRRVYTNTDAALADIFENLSNEAAAPRLEATKELLETVQSAQWSSPELIEKILRRLVRGLCSSRKSARLGFFPALIEVIRTVYGDPNAVPDTFSPSLGDLLSFIESNTRTDASASGQERRDHIFGRLYSSAALINSSVLLEGDLSSSLWDDLLNVVGGLAKEHPWVREECGSMLCKALRLLSKQEAPQASRHARAIVDALSKFKLQRTPEGVAIWLTFTSQFPDLDLPAKVWHKDDPLSKKERKELAAIMREDFSKASGPEASDGTNKSGSWKSQSNFAWSVLIHHQISRLENKTEAAALLEEFSRFWIDVVDNNLFSAKASAERKAWGLQILSQAIRTCPAWALFELLSPNILRSIQNQRSSPDSNLHGLALEPLKELIKRVKKTPDQGASIAMFLLSQSKSMDFDQATKSRTIETILSETDEEKLVDFVQFAKDIINRPTSQDEDEAADDRRAMADALLTMVKGQVKSGSEKETGGRNASPPWVSPLLRLMVELSYVKKRKSASKKDRSKPSISSVSREMFRSKLNLILGTLLASKDTSLWDCAYTAASYLQEDAQSGSTELVAEYDEKISEILESTFESLDEIHAKKMESDDSLRFTYGGLELLQSFTVLQIYNGEPEAVSVAEDLIECSKDLTGDDSEGNAIGAILEILISFASKRSTLMRKIAEQVFSAFTSRMDRTTLGYLTDILGKEESEAGQSELYEAEDDAEASSSEDEEDKEDSDTEESMDSDVEMVDGVDNEQNEFDAELSAVLRISNAQIVGPEDLSSSDEDEEEEDFDDEQMMALDDKISEVFKKRMGQTNKEKKKAKTEARDNMVQLKNRILDLLTILVKKEFGKEFVSGIILPLLTLVRTASTPQLSKRAFDLLKQYFDLGRGKEMPQVTDLSGWLSLLASIHEEAMRTKADNHGRSCSSASLFVVRVLVAQDRKHFDAAGEVYLHTKKLWFADPKSKLTQSFFSDWVGWMGSMRKEKSASH
ncbi:hypothetical protein P152DRAFT_442532 [Eremomyces bilateralis CBS 781.70]|uniref:DNA polymerase V n=1 Tax=Eremomyces bilateralis CBS 781.70 TaxID=1392243 RepID=A0A6G1FTG0_9PEZI|nr:uncharacterized protein P152DRAFT_442532 [Eremomyces bilateralis CBS 781.70]KAF1808998.1 hypothetical protein P152DRAFT_442532 [Eremomyces bilateralis CBS 781.70]